MESLCALLEKQGASLGQCYKNDKACAVFVHYIAADQRLKLLDSYLSEFLASSPMLVLILAT